MGRDWRRRHCAVWERGRERWRTALEALSWASACEAERLCLLLPPHDWQPPPLLWQAPVVHCCFVPGRPGTAVTADSRGVLLLHTLTSVPLLRLISASTKVATDGRSIGPLLDVRPLMPALPPRGGGGVPQATNRPGADGGESPGESSEGCRGREEQAEGRDGDRGDGDMREDMGKPWEGSPSPSSVSSPLTAATVTLQWRSARSWRPEGATGKGYGLVLPL